MNNNLEKDLNNLATEEHEEDSFTEEIKVVPIAKRKMAKWDSTMTMILPSKFSVGTWGKKKVNDDIIYIITLQCLPDTYVSRYMQ